MLNIKKTPPRAGEGFFRRRGWKVNNYRNLEDEPFSVVRWGECPEGIGGKL